MAASAPIVPTQEDFLFIKPGGQWQKVRQHTKWDSKRLKNLADEYSAFSSYTDKRDFVTETVLKPTKENGGRFLRGTLVKQHESSTESISYVDWTIVDEPCEEVMRILRQRRKRTLQQEQEMIADIETVDEKLGQLSEQITGLQATVGRMKTSFVVAEDGKGVKRPRVADELTSYKKRKVMKSLDRMVSDALACSEQLHAWLED